MSLHDRLTEDLKSAMKSRDQLRMDVIRMIKAAVQYKEVELKQDLDDAAMSRIMTTLIKQRKEAAEQFEKGNRQDLATKERQEISIIEGNLPAALSSDELARIVDAAVKESGATALKDMGQVMKAVMARLAGQSVDGKVVLISSSILPIRLLTDGITPMPSRVCLTFNMPDRQASHLLTRHQANEAAHGHPDR